MQFTRKCSINLSLTFFLPANSSLHSYNYMSTKPQWIKEVGTSLLFFYWRVIILQHAMQSVKYTLYQHILRSNWSTFYHMIRQCSINKALLEWYWRRCQSIEIGFGDNTDLLWWNNVNNQFCQLTTRVSYQRGIRRPFKCTGNHTYWGLKNNRGMQSKNGLQNVREYRVLHSLLRN